MIFKTKTKQSFSFFPLVFSSLKMSCFTHTVGNIINLKLQNYLRFKKLLKLGEFLHAVLAVSTNARTKKIGDGPFKQKICMYSQAAR